MNRKLQTRIVDADQPINFRVIAEVAAKKYLMGAMRNVRK